MVLKIQKRIQKFKGAGDAKYIYQNEVDKTCFQHDMVMGILKIYLKEQLLINFYMIKHLILLKIQNLIDITEIFLQWFTIFLNKSRQVVVSKVKIC